MKIKKRETFCLQFRACSCIVLEPTQNNAARAKNAFKKHPGLAKFGIAPGLGPGDRGFKSRSPDQNRQFSSRKPAVLTFLKDFSLFIAAQYCYKKRLYHF